MNITKRILTYVLLGVFLVALVVSLTIGGFMTAGEISSLTMVINEGMRARVDYILNGGTLTDLDTYYTDDYLSIQNLTEQRLTYARFKITDFIYRLEVDTFVCWPWNTRIHISAKEYVLNLDGYVPDTAKTEAELAQEQEILPPDWVHRQWDITLVKENGFWKIDRVTQTAILIEPTDRHNHAPATTLAPTATGENTPAPTATPAPIMALVSNGGEPLVVHSGAGETYAQINTVADDEWIAILQKGKTWCTVSVGNRVGYVATAKLIFPEAK